MILNEINAKINLLSSYAEVINYVDANKKTAAAFARMLVEDTFEYMNKLITGGL